MIVPPGGATRYAITAEPTLYDRELDNKRYERPHWQCACGE